MKTIFSVLTLIAVLGSLTFADAQPVINSDSDIGDLPMGTTISVTANNIRALKLPNSNSLLFELFLSNETDEQVLTIPNPMNPMDRRDTTINFRIFKSDGTPSDGDADIQNGAKFIIDSKDSQAGNSIHFSGHTASGVYKFHLLIFHYIPQSDLSHDYPSIRVPLTLGALKNILGSDGNLSLDVALPPRSIIY
jgi:hypothetical protein